MHKDESYKQSKPTNIVLVAVFSSQRVGIVNGKAFSDSVCGSIVMSVSAVPPSVGHYYGALYTATIIMELLSRFAAVESCSSPVDFPSLKEACVIIYFQDRLILSADHQLANLDDVDRRSVGMAFPHCSVENHTSGSLHHCVEA